MIDLIPSPYAQEDSEGAEDEDDDEDNDDGEEEECPRGCDQHLFDKVRPTCAVCVQVPAEEETAINFVEECDLCRR